MRRELAFIIADHITLIAAGLIDKIRGLVHVVPDARDSVVGVSPMKIAPPFACVGFGEGNEDAITRPNSGNEKLTAFAMLKIISGETLIKNVIGSILAK